MTEGARRPARPPLVRPLALANLALLVLYPVCWMAPLARAGVMGVPDDWKAGILAQLPGWTPDAVRSAILAVRLPDEVMGVPLFHDRAISIAGGIRSLWASDPALAGLVVLFAVLIPYIKTLTLAAIHAGRAGGRALRVVEAVGRLSMADVFLIALYIVLAKGVGLGHVTSAWGLWLFTGCVLVQLGIGHATHPRGAA